MRVNEHGQSVQVGWGANCNRHHNASDAAAHAGCKKQLQYGGLDDNECLLQLKRWLIHGTNIPDEGERAHVELNARNLTTPSIEEVEAFANQ